MNLYIIIGLAVIIFLSIVAICYLIVSVFRGNQLQKDVVDILKVQSEKRVSPVTAEAWGYMQNKVDTILKDVSEIDDKTTIIIQKIEKVDSKV